MTKITLERPDQNKAHFQVKEREEGLDGFIDKLFAWLPVIEHHYSFYAVSFPNKEQTTHFIIYSSPVDIFGAPCTGSHKETLRIVNVNSGDIEQARKQAVDQAYQLAKDYADKKSGLRGCQTSDLTAYSPV